MIYLLKITIAWTVFLFLFEVLYKSSRKFTVNRFFLLFSIAAGLLLPLVSLPSNVPGVASATQAFYPAMLHAAPQVTTAATKTLATPAVATKSINVWLIVRVVYGIGIAFLILKFLFESIRIARLIYRYPSQIVAGHKVIVTGKKHAPFSFMRWIFIGDLHAYQPAELEYIIGHEAAHNYKKHWLDLLLVQLACISLWFHPLIWRYRYLLQLQHEYEADDLAARDDAYAYGHFLLQQTLFNGVPSIAHSFHFSPIKNRIKMLTKKQNQKTGSGKYLLVIPVLLGCTFLMAKAAAKPEHEQQKSVMTYKGNTFAWRTTDTLYYDGQRKEAVPVPADKKRTVIASMNGESVYENEYLKTPASYGKEDMDYADYIRKEFSKRCKFTIDSLTGIGMSNIVVDKKGKVVYYNVQYYRPYLKTFQGQPAINPFPERDFILNGIMDKIISEGPEWKPAVVNGQPVNSVVNLPGC